MYTFSSYQFKLLVFLVYRASSTSLAIEKHSLAAAIAFKLVQIENSKGSRSEIFPIFSFYVDTFDSKEKQHLISNDRFYTCSLACNNQSKWGWVFFSFMMNEQKSTLYYCQNLKCFSFDVATDLPCILLLLQYNFILDCIHVYLSFHLFFFFKLSA